MTSWYYADHLRQQHGPIDSAQLVRLYQDNGLTLDSLVWREGLANWQPMREIATELPLAELAPSAPATEVSPPQEVEVAMPAASALVNPALNGPTSGWASSAAQDPHHQPHDKRGVDSDSPYTAPTAIVASHTTVVTGGEVVYAGFWKRVAASLIDSCAIGFVSAVVGGTLGFVLAAAFGLNGGIGAWRMVIVQLATNVVSVAMTAAYYAWFHASNYQATPGKMAVGIKVVRLSGEPISFLRGIGRYFATILSGITLGIGFVMAGFTARKQALHDMVCDTLVVDKWAFSDHPEWQRRELGTLTIVILVVGGLLLTFGLGALILVAIGLVGTSGSPF